MPTFKNISDQTFIDGNITVLPGKTLTVNDPARIDQLTGQYGWQFENLDAPKVGAKPEDQAVKPVEQPKKKGK